MSSRTILKSNPSWRFKYFHGKSENLYSRSYSKDLFYLIIFIVTASGKDCTLCFIFQCPAPLAGDSWAPRSKEKFFQGELCLLFFFCLSHCPWAVFDTKPWKLQSFCVTSEALSDLPIIYPEGWKWKWMWIPDPEMQQRFPDSFSVQRYSFGRVKTEGKHLHY